MKKELIEFFIYLVNIGLIKLKDNDDPEKIVHEYIKHKAARDKYMTKKP